MESIWKFKLEVADSQTVKMPEDAEIICVQIQHGEICVWVKVNIEAPKEDKVFKMYGTGHEHAFIEGKYVGSVQQMNGQLVWHIFVLEN